MAIRILEYTVSIDTITNACTQYVGTQGDKNVTELVFRLDEQLIENLKDYSGNGKFYYRFDGYDGAGGMSSTEPIEFNPSTENSFSYLVEKWQTKHGGIIQTFFVISFIEKEKTELELYAYSVRMKLKSKPDAAIVGGENYESITALAVATKKYAEEVALAKNYIINAEKRVEGNLAGYIPLNANLEIIFDGGDSSAKGEMFNTIAANRILEMADYPIEEGFSGIWNYRKWKNGVVDLWGHSVYTCPISISNGGEVEYSENFPFPLNSTIYTFIHPAINAYKIKKVYNLDSTANELKMFAKLEDTEGFSAGEKMSFIVNVKAYWK